MNYFLSILLLTLFSSCCKNTLITQTQFLSRQDLASYHIYTPDPALNRPLIGQRLVVHWNLDKNLFYENLHLLINIRFVNRELHTEKVPIHDLSGYFIYNLKEDEFCEKEGILTYKVDLIGNNCILKTSQHQLWVDIITVGEEENCEE